jgi:LacI family transcriptional regulator
MSKVTMDYIAKIANVSKSTVSRALNNDPRVNDDTRERINQIARDLNYKPHQVAQALAKNNTNIIGVVIPWLPRSVADPFFLEFLQGIGEVAHERGYSLTLPNIEINRIENLLNTNLDGIILTEPFINDPRIELLKGKGIPFVFLGNPMSGDEVCWVEVDNETGAFQAVNYLIKSGHKKIATIAGSSDLVAGKYRLEGYKRALREGGLQLDEDLIKYADFTQEGAYEAARELLRGKQDFSAVFAANDLMAMGVIRALKEAGIKIPEEIAVMGYDGIQIGEFIEPPLSTIKLPSVKMGRVAMNLLLKLINNEKIEERQVLLSPRILLRYSA